MAGHEHKAPPLKAMVLSGGLAGMLADGLTYPMATVKARMQVAVEHKGAADGIVLHRGPLKAIQSIAFKEGAPALYRGCGTVALTLPAQMLYMGTYQSWKRGFPGGQTDPTVQFFGGLLATLAQSTVLVPLEVIRQRQMVQDRAKAGPAAYKGSIHTLRTILHQEGAPAFYRGFVLTQMVWGPFNAIHLPLWEFNKRLAVRYTGRESVEQLPVQYELASAFVSSAFASGVTNPMDVIKTRIQVAGKSADGPSPGAMEMARSVLAKEGFVGFWKGVVPRMLWVAPSCTIMFTAFDQLVKAISAYEL